VLNVGLWGEGKLIGSLGRGLEGSFVIKIVSF